MAVTFSKLDIGAGWTELLTGSTTARFGIQVALGQPVRVAISTTAPAANSEDYLVLGDGHAKAFSEEILSADKVFVRTHRSSGVGAVRGFRVPR